MNNRILITGANGFVGKYLCKQASSYGFSILGALRTPCFSTFGLEQYICGEINGLTNWDIALRNVNFVVHVAARVHVAFDHANEPLTAYRSVNVDGTMKLARQAAAAGVKRFVFISSIKVNGDCTDNGRAFNEADLPNPQDAYAQSKLEAEQALFKISAETGMEVVIIRPPLIYGPGVKANFASLISAVKCRLPLPFGAVHNQRSLVGLDNLVDFIITCITHPHAANQIFMVSDGQDLSTSELVQAIAKAAGVSVYLPPIPVYILRSAASLLGKAYIVDRLCNNLQVDISSGRSLLGWLPPLSVEEGLRRTVVLHNKIN